MKICHLCLNGPYNEGWNYQENILPKYHVKQGHEVYQIVTPYMWEGTEQVICNDRRYVNANGVHVIRCIPKRGWIGGTRLNRYPEIGSLLEEVSPDILFIHDVQFMDAPKVAKYLKANANCIAYADNHSDFSNSARNWLSKNVLHKVLWKYMARTLNPYIAKFYGVLPARVDFLVNMYGIEKEKCELLVMGADDELVEMAADEEQKRSLRERYNVDDKDFLIVTGGKIDKFKTQTLMLMKAVKKFSDVRLIVFGSIAPELQKEVDALLDNNQVRYIGWLNAEDTYPLFAIADLVVFPGRHSVFWEQVVGQGIPLMVKQWKGTTHVDIGGNVVFLKEDSEAEIEKAIREVQDSENYHKLRRAAQSAREQFMYSYIAKKSIEG